MCVISEQRNGTPAMLSPLSGTPVSRPVPAIEIADRIANRVADKLFLPLGNFFWCALIVLYLALVLGILSSPSRGRCQAG
jgi:hypothetical protein